VIAHKLKANIRKKEGNDLVDEEMYVLVYEVFPTQGMDMHGNHWSTR
jgi:hypothetical protein